MGGRAHEVYPLIAKMGTTCGIISRVIDEATRRWGLAERAAPSLLEGEGRSASLNRYIVEICRRSGNLPTPRAMQEKGKQRRREDAASCYRTLRYRGEEEKAA